METNRIIRGDSMDVLDDLESESVHAVVCDPPYGLNFMGRSWDDFEPKEYQEWCERWSEKALRVLKPGGHLLAFSGNRTHHRMFTGVEDAGFTVRDTITWHYGNGFPKGQDMGRLIDKREGELERREQIGDYDGKHIGYDKQKEELGERPDHYSDGSSGPTAPATSDAKKWDGWNTQLKPATEYVVVARKPFDGATVDCVLEHGTGALNIDKCRVESEERPNMVRIDRKTSGNSLQGSVDKSIDSGTPDGTTTEGRYPANVVFDEHAAERLDEEVGELAGGAHTPRSDDRNIYSNGDSPSSPDTRQQLESGGPSRYFYTSKASKAERTLDGKIENGHPTVKPVDLMEWLVKLVTAEGQVVLDPFAGSGTTCKAAKNLQREFVGIEEQERWADVARVRCGLAPHDPSHVRADDGAQQGLELYTDGGL